jgi:uncharacterized membrane protein (UPF0127 family)
MKLRHPIVITALTTCFCIVLILAALAGAIEVIEELSGYGNPLMPVQIKGVTVVAEVVASPEKLYLGLSHREGLAPGRGMLFIMPTPEIQQFCMRGMRFAIDIIWIGEGRVVGCETNIAADDPRTLTSPAPVKYVLEVPAGFCDTHRLASDDQVTFIRP